MVNTEAEAMLKHLGLTEYEAKAWLTLISHGSCTAEKISSLSDVPLPRVYDTMVALAERGLVIITKTRPQTYRSTNPKRFFELLKEDEQRKMQEKIKKIEDVSPQFLRVISNIPKITERETEEVFAYVKRKVNMEKLWFELNSQARNEVFIFAGDLSWVKKTAKLIKNVLKKGVNYKVLFCKSDKNAISNVKKILKLGINAKYCPSLGNLRGLIIDDKRVSIVQTEKGSIKELKYTTIMMNNKLIVNVFKQYFLSLWKYATEAKQFLKTI